MNKTTTLTLNEDQLMRLLDGMLSTQEPLELSDSGCNKVERLLFVSNDHKAHKSLINRLERALRRVSADAPAAPTSQRVHLPKVEALLNELL